MSEIIIYKNKVNETQVEVRFEGETFWLTLNQIAELFERDKSVVSRHIKNIFKEKELEPSATVAKNATVQKEGERDVLRNVEFYNLDMILSIGYRVNSKMGTQFRQWANQRLKDFLVQGYSINQKRLEQLEKVIEIVQNTDKMNELQVSESKGLLEILSGYTKSFVLLNQYDSNSIQTGRLNENITHEISYTEAKNAIDQLKARLILKKEATDLFGKEKDESFISSLRSITQTFDGQYLYTSVEEQAANLLYFIIKNHSFNDGNKRIGAFLFILFLERNKYNLKRSGEAKINDNGLIALALLVAQSKPDDKDLMIALVMNLINDAA